MEWIKITIETSRHGLEYITDILAKHGVYEYEIKDPLEMAEFLSVNRGWDYIDETLLDDKSLPVLIIYLPANEHGNKLLENICSNISALKETDAKNELGSLHFTEMNVDDNTWLEKWKEFYKPFKVGKQTIIRPYWEKYKQKDGELVFSIDPGNVFGTGQHQSTQICITFLEDMELCGKNVLDIGSGSGILGILSLMRGAASAHCMDIDPAAELAAYENARLNNIDFTRFIAEVCDIFKERDGGYLLEKYDLIIANIVADTIIDLTPIVSELLNSGGIFMSSGIIDTRLDEVCASLTKEFFTDITVKTLDGWCGCVAVRA